MTKHMVIPDTQVKPGDLCERMTWAGKYAAEKQPDVIIHIGDHWDMESLCSYDKGKREFEGRRYVNDIAAGNLGIDLFDEQIEMLNDQRRREHKALYRPRKIFCLGNHEFRIERACSLQPELDGMLGYHDFNLQENGWEMVPFLEVITVDGVAYSHYFTSGVMGRPVTNAGLMIRKKMMSCVMGHVQHRDIGYAQRADGKRVTGIFAGTFYEHDEAYLGPQGNQHWRGLWMLHEVEAGQFDEMPVSISYLEKKYGR